ncbi:hypothetical protein AG1IA_03856 [Rhizoctonia solani AG-1 IA]|uniref:Uncharacterized protein n=1 Tax=Thanatephorus cucumeris (strain AG1-IA) TaxID=983506 RepID=L8X0G4_THACA|nr:hypothetical protein AG1IA_03856 [Rhizoctonia solani AG-1 IA]
MEACVKKADRSAFWILLLCRKGGTLFRVHWFLRVLPSRLVVTSRDIRPSRGSTHHPSTQRSTPHRQRATYYVYHGYYNRPLPISCFSPQSHQSVWPPDTSQVHFCTCGPVLRP